MAELRFAVLSVLGGALMIALGWLATPAIGYRQENQNRRCDLELEAASGNSDKFLVFVRQSSISIDGFSIGLRYQSASDGSRSVTLIRYNGPHGEYSRNPDGHYALPHIHRIAAAEIERGFVQPQESHREITERYSTFEQALFTFFQDINATNYEEHFPELRQMRSSNGCQ